MENLKEIRWKQRFENFDKSYKLLKKYSHKPIVTELERAGIIHFFEMTFELAWKVLKDYLESEGYIVKSPRETVKQAFQIGLIDNGHVWIYFSEFILFFKFRRFAFTSCFNFKSPL